MSSVVNFGAFVDLGGMDGLVHVSELSWKHVDHPSSVVHGRRRDRGRGARRRPRQGAHQPFAQGDAVGPVAGVRRLATRSGQLVYGRITKLVPFGAFVQVGDGIEGLVHISEMAVHHVDLPEQVVTPGEELWVKIIDIDLQRRRISLSIKQAAEGGEVSEEYREAFGEHAYDEEGNYIGFDYAEGEFTPETEAQAAWADFATEVGTQVQARGGRGRAGRGRRRGAGGEAPAAEVASAEAPAPEPAAEAPAE